MGRHGCLAALTSAVDLGFGHVSKDVTYTSQLEASAHVSVPVLYVSEPDDPTATPDVTRSLQEAAPPGLAETALAAPGAGHDIAMLYADGALTERSDFAQITLLAYLRAHTGG